MHDEIARKLGKTRTAIAETLNLNKLPEDVQEGCRQADTPGKSMLLQVTRQESPREVVEARRPPVRQPDRRTATPVRNPTSPKVVRSLLSVGCRPLRLSEAKARRRGGQAARNVCRRSCGR